MEGRVPELGERLATDNLQALGGRDGLLGLELEAAVEHADAHHREQVVRGVRVVVHAAEERRRRVLAGVLREQVAAAGVFVEEGRHVVDEAADYDERPRLRLLLDYIKGNVKKNPPEKWGGWGFDLQLSQLMTGRWSEPAGHSRSTDFSLSFLSCIVS